MAPYLHVVTSGITRRAVLDYSKLSYMIILGAIIYNEYLAYYSAHTRWPNLPQMPNDKQGELNSPGLNLITVSVLKKS